VLSGRSKFKQVRHFVVLATLVAAATGCAMAPHEHEAPRATRTGVQPLDWLQVAILPPERDLQAQLMAGDFALASNDLKAAAEAYGNAAQLSDDPRVAGRATELLDIAPLLAPAGYRNFGAANSNAPIAIMGAAE